MVGGGWVGWSVVSVMVESVVVAALQQRIATFLREESRGQRLTCRVGTVRQEELLGRLARRAPLGSAGQELGLLGDIASVARDASICGLGQTAVTAAISAVSLGLIGGPGLAAVPAANGKEP